MIFSACRSSWICVSALWFASLAANAQSGLEVRTADRELVSSEPRQVVATAFRVRNLGSVATEVETRLELPAGWQEITLSAPLALAPGESSMRLVSFAIPEGARAGDYVVGFAARDRLRPAFSDSAWLRVRVLATHRLSLVMLDVPDNAVAGESVVASVVFRNAGNAAVSLDYRVTGRHLLHITPRQGTMQLEPAETRRVELAMEVDELRDRAAGRLSVQAEIADTDIHESMSGMVQIIPRSGRLDALRTLASRVETRFVARETREGRTAGWQPALSGGGVLDEGRGDILRYSLRGPDRRQNGSYGASEEYWVRYDARNFSLGAGDLTYMMTPLTEPGRLGRGASVSLREESWGISAFGMRDNFGDGALKQAGATAMLRPSPTTELALNFLGRGELGDIWTARAQATSPTGVNLDLELARSLAPNLQGGAMRVDLRGARNSLRYYASGWSADERFVGPLRDKAYLSAGFDLSDPGGWTWRGYYRLQNWNLTPLQEIDPDALPGTNETQRMRVMPEQRQAGLGTGHALGEHLSATLDLVWRHRDGRSAPAGVAPLQEQRSGSWRAGISSSWQALSLQYSLEKGRAESVGTDTRFDTSAETLAASWRAGWLSCGAYLMRDEQSDLDALDPERTSRGINASVSRGGFSMTLDAQRSEARSGRSSISALTTAYQSGGGGRWSLAARRLEGRFARTDYFLSYSMPFRLPVMPRRDVSTIRGRVFDAETRSGMGHVVLRLDGRAAVTNEQGEFRFSGVPAGAHPISLDQAAMTIDQVPASDAPRQVEVSAGRPSLVLIPMMHSVEIRVRVTLQDDPHVPARAAAGVLVSFTQGGSVLRRLTDAAGEARIGGIPPGSWNIAVDEKTLPPGMRPAQSAWPLEVAPGGKAAVQIPLMAEKRALRMQTPLAVR